MDRDRQDWIMNTQRRDERSTPAAKIRCLLSWALTRLASCKSREGHESPSFPKRSFPASNLSRTAHQHSPGLAVPDSLPSDHRKLQPIWLVQLDNLPGVPLPGPVVGLRPLAERPSGNPPIHFSAVFAPIHRTLPQVPAASGRRTERYDGKGNLYFQHAA